MANIRTSTTRCGLSTNVSSPDTHCKNGFVSPESVTCDPGVNVGCVWPEVASRGTSSGGTGERSDALLSENSDSESEPDSSVGYLVKCRVEECPVVSGSEVFRPVKFVHSRPCFCAFICFSVEPLLKSF